MNATGNFLEAIIIGSIALDFTYSCPRFFWKLHVSFCLETALEKREKLRKKNLCPFMLALHYSSLDSIMPN